MPYRQSNPAYQTWWIPALRNEHTWVRPAESLSQPQWPGRETPQRQALMGKNCEMQVKTTKMGGKPVVPPLNSRAIPATKETPPVSFHHLARPKVTSKISANLKIPSNSTQEMTQAIKRRSSTAGIRPHLSLKMPTVAGYRVVHQKPLLMA